MRMKQNKVRIQQLFQRRSLHWDAEGSTTVAMAKFMAIQPLEWKPLKSKGRGLRKVS